MEERIIIKGKPEDVFPEMIKQTISILKEKNIKTIDADMYIRDVEILLQLIDNR
jgi:hypothetical protein